MDESRASFSRDEVARQLGVSRDSVIRAMKRGEIKGVRFGRRILIPRAELDRIFSGFSVARKTSGASEVEQ